MSDAPVAASRLDSWKAIASYTGRTVRTVIRWEKTKGLPVHRVPGGQRQAVFAYTHEIDEWLRNGYLLTNELTSDPEDQDSISDDISPDRTFFNRFFNRFLEQITKLIRSRRFLWITSTCALVTTACFAFLHFAVPPKYWITGETQLTSDLFPKDGLVTDGNNLYFGELHEGRLVLSVLPVSGGSTAHIATPFTQTKPVSISPDGKQLLILASEGVEHARALWSISVEGGPPHRIDNIFCDSAAWSPDGRQIAYTRDLSIFLVDANGANQHLLYTFSGIPSNLRWSLDGKRILFRIQDPQTMNNSIWELTLAGDDRSRVVSLSPFSPATSNADAISPPLDQNDDALVHLDDQARPIMLLTRSRWPWNHSVSHSQFIKDNGRVDDLTVDPQSRQIFILKAESAQSDMMWFDRKMHEFRQFLPGISACEVNYSRDGRHIVYIRLPENSLWVAEADGRSARQIPSHGLIKFQLPRWSPDGKQIAFMARHENGPYRIFVVPAAGGTPREASRGNDDQGAPTWSPDGRRLSYGRILCEENHSCAILQINIETHQQNLIPGSEGLGTARWSPDGRFIAALNPQLHQVALLDLHSGNWRKLADGANGDDLDWSSDSQTVYTSRPNGAHPNVFSISLKDGTVQTVVDLTDFSKLSGRVNTWFTVTPDGSILLRRDISGNNIYALHYDVK